MNLIDCPTAEILKEFLQGRLESPTLERCEHHVAECDSCHETLRGLNSSDTLGQYVADAFAQSVVSDDDEPQIRSLIERLVNSAANQEDGFETTPRVMPRRSPSESPSELETLADRAAEVLRCLDVEEDRLGTLAEYRLQRLVGAGSSGVVFQAIDQRLNRPVALKVLRPSLGPLAHERFIVEAQAAAAIEHPNVVTIFEVGEADRLAFLAMQWVPGRTLESALSSEQPLDEAEVRRIAIEIARGLTVAHRKQMIHRDIKPANIWLGDDGQAIKILDFGLARITDDDPGLTATGMLAGTPNYMSPEQARGLELDGRSDLFSLGCLMYRMLTGRLPFGAPTVLGTLQAIQHHQPVPVHGTRPDVSKDLADLTMALLEKQPSDRPATAEQLVAMLERDRDSWPCPIRDYDAPPSSMATGDRRSASIENKPEPAAKRPRKGLLTASLIGLLLLTIGSVVYGQQIIRIITNQGELIIKSDDPHIKVSILEDGQSIKVIDEVTQQGVNIRSGEYEILAVPKDADKKNQIEYQVSPAKLTMSRGGRQVVTIAKKSSPGSSGPGRLPGNRPAGFGAGASGAGLPGLAGGGGISAGSGMAGGGVSGAGGGSGVGGISPGPRGGMAGGGATGSGGGLSGDGGGGGFGLGSVSAAQPRSSGQSNAPLYNGQNFSHWIRVAQIDRHPPTLADAIVACGQLAENQREQNQLMSVIGTAVKSYGSQVIGADQSVDLVQQACLRSLRKMPPEKVAQFVVDQLEQGNERSLDFCTWITANRSSMWADDNSQLLSENYTKKLKAAFVQRADQIIELADERNNARVIANAIEAVISSDLSRADARRSNPNLLKLVDRAADSIQSMPTERLATLYPLVLKLGTTSGKHLTDAIAHRIFDPTTTPLERGKLILQVSNDANRFSAAFENRPLTAEAFDHAAQLELMVRFLERQTGSQPLAASIDSFSQWSIVDQISSTMHASYYLLGHVSAETRATTKQTFQAIKESAYFQDEANQKAIKARHQLTNLNALIDVCDGKQTQLKGGPVLPGQGGFGGGYGGGGFGGGLGGGLFLP